MKKLTALALTLLICLGLTGCGDSPEKTAEKYPELIGEWGTVLRSEEPLAMLRADGVCVYNQQEGKWRLDGRETSDDRRVAVLTMPGGEKVRIAFWREIFSSGNALWTASEEGNYAVDLPLINRDQYRRPQKILDAIAGTWRAAGAEEPALTLNEDGTCVVGGQSGEWCETMESWRDERDDLYAFVTRTDDGQYRTFIITKRVTVTGGDRYGEIYFQNQSQIDYMEGKLPSGSYKQFADRAVRAEDVDEIEITADNFFDYFEAAEKRWWEKNAFGDYTDYTCITYLRLKDEYVPRLCAGHSQIAVEIASSSGYYTLEGTLGGDMTLVYDETNEDYKDDYVTQSAAELTGDQDVLFGVSVQPFFYSDRERYEAGLGGSYVSGYEVTRAAGTLCLTKE